MTRLILDVVVVVVVTTWPSDVMYVENREYNDFEIARIGVSDDIGCDGRIKPNREYVEEDLINTGPPSDPCSDLASVKYSEEDKFADTIPDVTLF